MKPWRQLARPMAAGLLRRTKGAPDAHTDIARTADRRWLRCCRTLGNWGRRMGDQPVAGAPDLLRVSGNDYRTGNTVLPGSANGETQRWTSPAGGCYWHRDARCSAGARSRTALDCGSRGVLFRVVQRCRVAIALQRLVQRRAQRQQFTHFLHLAAGRRRHIPSDRPRRCAKRPPLLWRYLFLDHCTSHFLSLLCTSIIHLTVQFPSQFSVPGSRFLVLSSWFPVPGSQFSLLTIHRPNFWYPIP